MVEIKAPPVNRVESRSTSRHYASERTVQALNTQENSLCSPSNKNSKQHPLMLLDTKFACRISQEEYWNRLSAWVGLRKALALVETDRVIGESFTHNERGFEHTITCSSSPEHFRSSNDRIRCTSKEESIYLLRGESGDRGIVSNTQPQRVHSVLEGNQSEPTSILSGSSNTENSMERNIVQTEPSAAELAWNHHRNSSHDHVFPTITANSEKDDHAQSQSFIKCICSQGEAASVWTDASVPFDLSSPPAAPSSEHMTLNKETDLFLPMRDTHLELADLILTFAENRSLDALDGHNHGDGDDHFSCISSTSCSYNFWQDDSSDEGGDQDELTDYNFSGENMDDDSVMDSLVLHKRRLEQHRCRWNLPGPESLCEIVDLGRLETNSGERSSDAAVENEMISKVLHAAE